MPPTARINGRFGFHTDCVIEPALDQIHLELAFMQVEPPAFAVELFVSASYDRPRLCIGLDPGSHAEFVVESELALVTLVDHAGAIESRGTSEDSRHTRIVQWSVGDQAVTECEIGTRSERSFPAPL